MTKKDALIRMAEPMDTQAILDIYAPYVTKTALTITSTVPKIDAVQKKMRQIKRNFPYLVCSVDDKVVGFAFANAMQPHEAYAYNAQLSVYIDSKYHGRGIATALYTALFQILKAQGFCNLYAIISMPNNASVALHKHFGFYELALHKADCYKLGAWRDTLWMHLRINGNDPTSDGPPLALNKLRDNDIATALHMATALLVGAW